MREERAAIDFPSVFYVDTEGGADLAHYTDKLSKSGGVYLGPEDGACDFATVLGQIKALASEAHSHKTLVIDSISKLFNSAVSLEAERLATRTLLAPTRSQPLPTCASWSLGWPSST